MRQKGFTFIELFIVIAIIAVLAIIAVPAINDVISRGKQAATQNQQFQGVPGISCAPAPDDSSLLVCSNGQTYRAN